MFRLPTETKSSHGRYAPFGKSVSPITTKNTKLENKSTCLKNNIEASSEVERVIGVFAASGAAKQWRSMHVASPTEAKGGLAWLLRRRWP